jgi:hypothetical protein
MEMLPVPPWLWPMQPDAKRTANKGSTNKGKEREGFPCAGLADLLLCENRIGSLAFFCII